MKTSVLCILDRSGSMSPLVNDAIGGFNTFIKDQKESGNDVNVTTVLFDHEYEILYKNKPVSEVPELTTEQYIARGMTALYDALGRSINVLGAELAALPETERPDSVLVVVITDGEENSSREFNHGQVMEMINEQRDKYSWKFMYLCATESSLKRGLNLGFSQQLSAVYTPSPIGLASAYSAVSRSVASISSGTEVEELDLV